MTDLEDLMVNLRRELDGIKLMIDIEPALAKKRIEKLITIITDTINEG